jgi:K+-sensing histidine kinase KdpD
VRQSFQRSSQLYLEFQSNGDRPSRSSVAISAKIKRVIINLISNANYISAKDSEVRIDLIEDHDFVEVAVADHDDVVNDIKTESI